MNHEDKQASTEKSSIEKERVQNWLRVQQAMQQEQEEEYREFCQKRWPEVFSQIEKQKEGYL